MEVVRERSHKKNKAAQYEGPFFYPLHCIWLKTKKQIYACEHGELAFETSGSVHVVAGDPRAKTLEAQVKTYLSFCKEAHARGQLVCGYYFSKEFAMASGQTAHMCGVSRFQPIKGFRLDGGAQEEARRAVAKASDAELEVIRLDQESFRILRPQLEELVQLWQSSKGYVQIKFLLSEANDSFQALLAGNEEVFVCLSPDRTQALALLSLRRYFGNSHWYIDSLIQRPGGHKFALDACLVNAQSWLKSEKKAEVLALGFCPGIIASPETWVERALTWWKKTKLLYSPEGLYVFKRKYSQFELSRYLLLDSHGNALKQLWAMEIVTMFLRRK